MGSSELPWDVEIYCELVGFFALDASEQRQLVPNETEPKYASFKGGDGHCSHPLEVLLGNLYDASAFVGTHLDEPGYDLFVSEEVHYKLVEVLVKFDNFHGHRAALFEHSALDWEIWNNLRQVAINIWNALDEKHRLPLDDWWQYYG